MARIPLPQRLPQPGSSGGYTAQRVVPFQDQRGEQMEQLGRGAMVAGVGAQRVADVEQTRVRAARLKETDALQGEATLKVLRDFEGLKGKAAVDGRKAAEESVAKAIEDASKLLGDDAGAREMFATASAVRRANVLGRIDAHATAQGRAYEIAESEARIGTLSSEAVTFWQDPPATPNGAPHSNPGEMYRAAALRELDDYVKQTGMGPDEARVKRQEVLTSIHSGRVEGMLRGKRLDQAAAYLQGIPATEITPDARADLQGKMSTAAAAVARDRVNDEGVRLALQLMAPPPPPPKDGPETAGAVAEPDADRLQREESERLLRLRAAHDELDRRLQAGEVSAEVRARAISEIRSMEADRRQDLAVRSEQVMAQVERFLAANPNTAPNALPGDLQVAVDALGLRAKVNNFAENGRYATDPATWQELSTMMAQRPEALRSVTVEQLAAAYRGKLSTPYWNKLVEAHKDALAGKPSRVLEENERVLEAARAAGILPRGHGAEDAARSEDFFRFQVEVDNRLARLGKAATPEQLQAVLDAVGMDKVYRDIGGIFAADQLEVAATLTADELQTAYVQVAGENVQLSAIPRRDVTEITEDLAASGRMPTKQAIAEAWVAHYRGRK